jgi:glycosyltransferase involved in cell wall biosynthesis
VGLGTYKESFPDLDERLLGYEEADYILCPSEWVKRSFVERGFPADKILKNPYGMNLAPKGDMFQRGRESFRILFVGQINFRKGLRYLIEAFRQIRHPNKELILVGPITPVTGLEKTTLPLGVTFKGELKGDSLTNAYRMADIFCLPSIEEGLALVMGEALSFGLPVVATSHTGAEDLFTDGREGFIVSPFSAAALTEAIQQLADDHNLRTVMSIAAIQRAESLGGWDQSVDALAATLVSLLHQ